MGEPTIDKASVEKIIRDYIVTHPEILIEAMQAAQRKQEEASAADTKLLIQAHRAELLEDPNALVFGNAKGDVTLVEFFDYRCPYCRQMEGALRKLVQVDPGLRVVQKQFPILGPESVLAARAALAANKQGKHLELHDAFMTRRLSFDEASIMSVAEAVGLNVAQLKIDMASPAVDAEIANSVRVARALKLKGTPAFIVGAELLPGATDLETLVAIVEDARQSQKSPTSQSQ